MSAPGSVGARLRVGLLTREYPPEVYGGAGVHVEYLAAALAGTGGLDVSVRCFGKPRTGPEVTAAYQPWDALPAEREGAALGALSVDLRLAAGASDVDLVHSHTWYANLGGHLASLAWGVPHVVTLHSLEPLRPWKVEQLGGGYAVSCWAERTAVEAADAVIAVSAGMAGDAERVYPALDRSRVHVIHNGIDARTYAPDPGTATLGRVGLEPGQPYVMWIGRVTRQKGIEHLLAAARRFDPDAGLVLCAGAADTAELGAAVEEQVRALAETRAGVHWLSGFFDMADKVQLLSHATVFVCPSVYEPFGLINVEAMACGVPVVASAVGGIPEVVVDGVTGRLVPFTPSGDAYGSPADPARFAADLADAVNDLLSEPARAAAMGRAGRERVLERFTWESIAARTLDLYHTLVR